ncbi:MAG TPA: rod shape-determining protein MreC [Clostridia bacterium]|nr:rod shape-determining protein MreC [Clostridia bacterium]
MLRLFKSKAFVIILVTVLLFTIMIISSNGNSKLNIVSNSVSTVFDPFQEFFSYSAKKVEGFFSMFGDKKALIEENKKLKSEIDKLKSDKRQLLEYKVRNVKLMEDLSLKNQFSNFSQTGANVIAKDMGNWFNTFKIDRGSKDGIKNNMPIVTSKGLVGRILSAEFLSSKVIPIIDPDSSVSGIIAKTRDDVIIKGDVALKDQGYCRMDYIPLDADITVGDEIITSGIGGIYPRGILIGTVKEIRRSNNNLSRYAIIKPSVDFRRLEEVYILENKVK